MKRYITQHIIKDLQKKMVFIGGPRQVGKTTLSIAVAEAINGKNSMPLHGKQDYFNWDVHEDRGNILKKQCEKKAPLIIFDELHKYPHWKRWIKGVFDIKPPHQEYLVTGSAKMDVYKRVAIHSWVDIIIGVYIHSHWMNFPMT